MTDYLTLNEALRIHDMLIDGFGGARGVRDLGLLESALLRPQTGYSADLIEEAAALWESLAMNPPFIDGNKRVAFAVVDLFLMLNAREIVPADDVIEAFIYAHLEAGTFAKDVLAAWLRANTAPLSGA